MKDRVRGRVPAVWITVLVAALAGPARAEDDWLELRPPEMRKHIRDAAVSEWEAIKKGLTSSFALPLGELVERRNESFWSNVVHGWSTSTSITVPVTPIDVDRQGVKGQGTRTGSAPALRQTLSYNPIGAWKGSFTFVYRLTNEPNEPWEGDFTYRFGYSDWRPYTLSLVYSNYGGNQFDPPPRQNVSTIEQGTITLAWKFPIHPVVFKYFALTPSSSMGCAVGYGLTPQWTGLGSNGTQWIKHRLSLGCKYTIWRSAFVSVNSNWYPERDQQQPWDPDFTYAFGWFDWRRGTFSVQYNNMSGNRFPWRKQPSGTGRFKNGSISVLYAWDF